MDKNKKVGYAVGSALTVLASLGTGYHFVPRHVQATVQSSGLVPNIQVSVLGAVPKRWDRARGRMVDDPLDYMGELDYLIVTDRGNFATRDFNLGNGVKLGETYDSLVNQWFNPLLGKRLNVVSYEKLELKADDL